MKTQNKSEREENWMKGEQESIFTLSRDIKCK